MGIKLPEAFTERMQAMLKEEYDDFIASYDAESIHGLRVNPLKTNGCSLDMFSLEQVPWCEEGFYYPEDERPGKHPYHEAGAYYIQEPSAMLVGVLAGALPGEKVLDLCAAPGGKTTHLAGHMKGQGLLWSNEIHPARAKILSQNVERLGITNCVVSNETAERLADRLPSFFDKIVVDAPCSGEGMFRKNPEACDEWSPQNVELCANRQLDILNEADRMLKSGGLLIYSTCTFAPEENEKTIEQFIKEHDEYSIVKVELQPVSSAKGEHGMPSKGRCEWSDTSMAEVQNTFRLWPHLLKGEGHFAAVLKKGDDISNCLWDSGNGKVTDFKITTADIKSGKKGKDRGKGRTAGSDANIKQAVSLFEQFTKESLNKDFEDRYILFGDNLHVIPDAMPDISGLKILRPGLHVGTIKKDRFEPSHALALSLKPEEAKNCLNLPHDDQKVYSYLRGESIEADINKGWVLVCVDGYSLGWGKVSQGIVKNHYPKGLRWN